MGDAMKSLENRALDSKIDMDILAALEEMKSMKVGSYTRMFFKKGQGIHAYMLFPSLEKNS